MKARHATLAALSSVLMSGCAVGTVGVAERAVDGVRADTARLVEQARQPMPAARVSPVRVMDGVWTGAVVRRSENGDPLPRRFETTGVTIVGAAPMDLPEIGGAITKATGLPVSFAADVFDAELPGASAAPIAPRAGDAADLSQLLGSMGLAPGGAGSAGGGLLTASTGGRGAMKVNHSGRLSSFLNQVASHFGVTWEHADGQIHVFRYVTRTYSVQALPSSIDVSSTLDAGNKNAGDSGDGTGSNQSAKSDVSVKIWDELTRAVEAIVGDNGRIATSVGTGTITVTAPADVTRRVQSYIDGQNARMAKQVAVSVQVLNVSLTDGDEVGLDLRAVFSGARHGFGIGNALAGAQAAAGMPGMTFGIIDPGSRWNGSGALLQALSERGRVSVVSTASVTTLNGIPAPLQVSNTRNYLERIEVTRDDNGVSTSLTPGTVTTGFNLSILPRVLDGGRLMMQFGINISELVGKKDGFDEFTVDDMTIQLPNKNSRSFVQQTMVPNGASLVLTGFEQLQSQATRQGVGRPDFMLLGGGQSGRQQRDVIVVILTPVLVDAAAPLITTD